MDSDYIKIGKGMMYAAAQSHLIVDGYFLIPGGIGIVVTACTRPLITELSGKLRLKYPLPPTISPYPTMRLETIRSIIPISCRRYPKSAS